MHKRSVKPRILICVGFLLLMAGAVAFMQNTENQTNKVQKEEVNALQQKARSYEKEVSELESELSALEENLSYSSEEAELMVGFLVSDVTDVTDIMEWEDTYSFTPVLVIDCAMKMVDIEACIDEAASDWEIMLYSSSFSSESNEDILSVLDYLDSIDREQTGIFFLRDDYCTNANVELLQDDGFVGYTSYHSDSPAAGQMEDGAVYFEYSFLRSSSSDETVKSRLSALYKGKNSMIIIFDMASVNAGSMSETYVAGMLNTLQEYSKKEECSFSTVADVVEELSQINEIEEALQEDYEEKAAEIEEQIAELEETIDDIYSQIEY